MRTRLPRRPRLRAPGCRGDQPSRGSAGSLRRSRPAPTVKADVERLLTSPTLPPKVSVSGHVYDIATGCLSLRVLRERVEEAEPVRGGGGLAAARRAELAEDVGHVHARGLHGDEQLPRDLTVAPPGRDQPPHLQLAGR